MSKIGAWILCVVTLCGCSTAPQRWYLHGRTNQQFQADYQQCQLAASGLMEAGAQSAASISQQSNAYNYQAAAGASLAALWLSHDLSKTELVGCMRRAGYTPAP